MNLWDVEVCDSCVERLVLESLYRLRAIPRCLSYALHKILNQIFYLKYFLGDMDLKESNEFLKVCFCVLQPRRPFTHSNDHRRS